MPQFGLAHRFSLIDGGDFASLLRFSTNLAAQKIGPRAIAHCFSNQSGVTTTDTLGRRLLLWEA
jgi:hypothetical protein